VNNAPRSDQQRDTATLISMFRRRSQIAAMRHDARFCDPRLNVIVFATRFSAAGDPT